MKKRWVAVLSIVAAGAVVQADVTVNSGPYAPGLNIHTTGGAVGYAVLGPGLPATGTPGVINVDSSTWDPVTGVSAFLEIHSTIPDDLELFIVNPNGEGVWLMGDAGGATDLGTAAVGFDLSFSDASVTPPPPTDPGGGWLVAPYMPTAPYGSIDADLGLAPVAGATSFAALVDGGSGDIDGDWLLYIYSDDTGANGHLFSWGLTFATAGGGGGGGGGGGPGSNPGTPEPSAALLGLLALAGAVTKRRRRQG